VLTEISTHAVLDAAVGGYRDGERGLALGLTGATSPGDLVIADRGFWSAEVVAAFTATGADLLFRLQSNHRGTVVSELADGSCLSSSKPSKQLLRRARAAGRVLPERITFRVISFATSGSVVHLGTTLTDPDRFPADELIALYRQRWEIELTFDELKNHLGAGGPLRSRTPQGVRQEIWAYLAVHHAVRQLAHDAAATAGPQVDSDRISYLKCVRIIRTSVMSQAAATPTKLARAMAQAVREVRHRLLAPRTDRRCPRAIKKPNRWPVLHSRAGRDQVSPGRHANHPTTQPPNHQDQTRPPSWQTADPRHTIDSATASLEATALGRQPPHRGLRGSPPDRYRVSSRIRTGDLPLSPAEVVPVLQVLDESRMRRFPLEHLIRAERVCHANGAAVVHRPTEDTASLGLARTLAINDLPGSR
jgi:hypothetical protein